MVLPLALVGQGVVARFPALGQALTLAAAAWVMYLAVRLWRPRPAAGAAVVTGRRVFVTTLLNPKGLIFGLILLPAAGAPDFAPRLAGFCLLVAAVAALWAAGGACLGRRSAKGCPPLLLCRAAACWLGLLSLGLAAGMAQG